MAGGVYVLDFKEEMIGVRMDRLDESHRQVTAEVTVRTTLPGIPPHLHQARLNLTSTAARKTLSKALTERLHLDWDALLEYACVLVLQAYRQGEPVVRAGSLPRSPDGVAYRLWPLLRQSEPAVLYGYGGTGKSYMAVLSCLLVQRGVSAGGLNGHPEPVPALYLDYESSPEEVNERVQWLRTGLMMPGDVDIFYRYSYHPLVDDLPEIQRIVADEKVGFLVVDSLGLACGGDPEHSDSALHYFAALRSLRLTSLTIHHQPKDSLRGAFGSIYIENMARNVWELKGQQEQDSNTLHIGLYHKKVNRGKLLRPMGLRLLFDDTGESTKVQSMDILSVPQLAAGASLRTRIHDLLLHSAGMTVKDLAETLGERGEQQIRNVLSSHKEEFVNITPGAKQSTWGVRTAGGVV